MEKKHRICKICNKRFANGKAMGGHMRSHLAKLPIPPKLTIPSSSSTLPPLNNIIKSPSRTPSLVSSPSSEVNHMQPYTSVKHELSSEATTSRRSKRLRKMMVCSSSESVSSAVVPISDESDEIISREDAALCLLTLSKDKWSPKQKQKEVDCEVLDDEEEDMNLEDNNDSLFFATKTHPKHKCETCNKVFNSHQALGGHRANHKSKQIIRASTAMATMAEGKKSNPIHQQRIFMCPFCDKVFQSGQALGGHKKVHFSYLPVARSKVYKTCSSTIQLFDLNLPATTTEDEEDISFLENSMASNYIW